MTLTKDWLQKFGWPETLLTGHPLAIAHRGASDYAPENTLKSFRIAADLCSEMWELDVRLSADGVCVVAHDDDLNRISGQDIRVSTSDWADIAALKLPEDQTILRLEQVIELAQETGCGLYIEIKSEGAGLVAWQALKDANFRFAVLASFVVPWVKELRSANCDYPLGVLVPPNVDPMRFIDGIDVEIIHPCWRDVSDNPHELLTDAVMQNFADHGHQIVIWHEDRAHVLDALLDMPVMGICSNRPELLKPYLPDPDRPIEIVCHRGANHIAPENTLEAVQICIDQRFQYVELDVRTTSDGTLVVVHDAGLERTTNGSGLVIDQSLGHIKSLDAGGWFRDGTTGYNVPTLAEILDLVGDRIGLYIEVKHADPQALMDAVDASNMRHNCFFWGWDIEIMRDLRALSADIVLMAPRRMYGSVREAVSAYGAQIVEFDVKRDDLAELKLCHELGVKSMIYSQTDDWTKLASYQDFRPDILNLDRPDRFKILSSYPKVRRHFSTAPHGCRNV